MHDPGCYRISRSVSIHIHAASLGQASPYSSSISKLYKESLHAGLLLNSKHISMFHITDAISSITALLYTQIQRDINTDGNIHVCACACM